MEHAVPYDAYFQEHYPRHLEELKDFLRIPSVSALPEHAPDMERAARWTAEQLRAAGVPAVEVLPSAGNPVVYGEWIAHPGKPTVIIYGHYDVQPADPVQQWTSPPFEPQIRDDRIYARGASDDKGNLFIPIKALEAFRHLDGAPPLNVKFIIEGEEEVGSPSLASFMAEHKEKLKADLAVSADGGMWDNDIPSLTLGSKGLAAIQLDVYGASADLHSGMHGGGVQNPLHALAALLASMRDGDGKIAVKGFYDDVRPLHEDERQAIARVPFDEEDYKAGHGVEELFGEPGYTTLERLWVRPTLEVNGMWGGFQGTGIKTVLPNAAHAKITCRLVPDQEPEGIIELLKAHVEAHTPPGVRVEATAFPGSSRPYSVPARHPGMAAAGQVLAKVYGRPPLLTRTGGTLPVAEMFTSILGVYLVFFAFGGPDNNVHAPDESLPLAAFRRGLSAYVEYLSALAGLAELPGASGG